MLFLGSQIVGKAFVEAGRQAVRNARAGRVEAGAAGMAGNTSTGNSITDGLTRAHRMTLDEARMILNLKTAGEAEREALLKNYEHLFATNAPPAPKGKTGGGSGSFYVQSKIVRARERLEAEWKEAAKMAEQRNTTSEQPNQGGKDGSGPSAPQ